MTHPVIEAMARAFCTEWGYEWDGNPEADEQVVTELDEPFSDRPSRQMFREAAIAALIAAAKVPPSEGMTQVGKDADLKAFLEEPSSIAAVGIYQAMFAQLVWEIEG
jgi:hypothetical protein